MFSGDRVDPVDIHYVSTLLDELGYGHNPKTVEFCEKAEEIRLIYEAEPVGEDDG